MTTVAYIVTRVIVGASAIALVPIALRLGARLFTAGDDLREPRARRGRALEIELDGRRRAMARRPGREDALVMRASTLVLVIAAVLAITPSVPRRAAAAPSTAQIAQDRVNAAAKVYAYRIEEYKVGRATVEDVYQWSVRWLAALRDQPVRGKAWKQALADHAQRMADLATEAGGHATAGTGTNADVEATEFYSAEAELWAARGKMP